MKDLKIKIDEINEISREIKAAIDKANQDYLNKTDELDLKHRIDLKDNCYKYLANLVEYYSRQYNALTEYQQKYNNKGTAFSKWNELFGPLTKLEGDNFQKTAFWILNMEDLGTVTPANVAYPIELLSAGQSYIQGRQLISNWDGTNIICKIASLNVILDFKLQDITDFNSLYDWLDGKTDKIDSWQNGEIKDSRENTRTV